MKVGSIFYMNKGFPKDKPYKCHVLAIVDEDVIVYKWFGSHKQRWHYEVAYIEVLLVFLNNVQDQPGSIKN